MQGADFSAAILAGITVAQNSKTWSGHDRVTTIGASEAGACARMVWYGKNGMPHDEGFDPDWGAAERGHAIEGWLVERLIAGLPTLPQFAGWKPAFVGDDQKTLTRGAQSATPDGVLLPPDFVPDTEDNCVYLEIKSADPRIFEPMQRYKMQHFYQTQQGMDLMRSTTIYRPRRSILIYVNASFVTQHKPFDIAFNEKVAANLQRRAGDIMFGKYTEANPPPHEGRLEGGKECDYCPFKRRCTAFQAAKIPGSEKKAESLVDKAELLSELAERAEAMLHYKAQAEAAEASQRAAQAEIFNIMEKLGTKKAGGDWGSVSVYKQRANGGLDKAKLAADGIDLDKYKTEGDYFPNMRITIKKVSSS